MTRGDGIPPARPAWQTAPEVNDAYVPETRVRRRAVAAIGRRAHSPFEELPRVDTASQIADYLGCPSVLYLDLSLAPGELVDRPPFFHDLHLDQVVDAVLAQWEAYCLEPFFHTPLPRLEEIQYRQAVMSDLESVELAAAIQLFSQRLRTMRAQLQHAEKCHYPYEEKRWILSAGEIYCKAVRDLTAYFSKCVLSSLGMRSIRDYLLAYVDSSGFLGLESDTAATIAALRAIRYTVAFKDGLTVRRYDDEIDYSEVVTALFKKFRQSVATDYLARFPFPDHLNHVDAMILERVALLYPEAFRELDAYCVAHATLTDDTVTRFEREVQFYLAFRAFIAPLKQAGLDFCYPDVSAVSKHVSATKSFDLALAAARRKGPLLIVPNDFELRDSERILVVTGPNHGGKTTFARMVGQLHYLACLGLPVPGTSARLILFDQLFSHFEKSEDITTLRGKLQDDLIRIQQILEAATPRSLIIMNEIFSSTTLEDAVFLSERIMATISDRDAIAVCVTFLVELTVFNEKTVSMVGAIDPKDPAVRTYRIERKPADGLAYALAIAEKHHVTHDWLLKRVAP